MYVADLIAGGDWYGRPTAKRLGALGGVDAESVRNYARAAAIVCEDDHGAIQQHRQESLGRWLALHEATMAGEEPDLRAAAAALAGYDRAAGVVEPGGPKVQVNVLQSPGVPELTRSLQAVVVTLIRMAARVEAERLGGLYRAWLEALDAGDAVASRDPAAWLEERARVVEAPLLPRREG